jgi:hypothetical protein
VRCFRRTLGCDHEVSIDEGGCTSEIRAKIQVPIGNARTIIIEVNNAEASDATTPLRDLYVREVELKTTDKIEVAKGCRWAWMSIGSSGG